MRVPPLSTRSTNDPLPDKPRVLVSGGNPTAASSLETSRSETSPPNSQPPSNQPIRSGRWGADILLVTTALVWGANLLVFKSAIGDLNPWVFNALRLVFATLTLGVLTLIESLWRPRQPAASPVRWWRVLVFAFFSGFLYLVVFVKGIDLTTAGNTALILASMPMWTAVLSYFFLHERLPRVTWMGLLVTFIGTAIVTTQGSGEVSFASRYFLGNLCMLVAAMAWASGTVMSRPILEKISPLRLAFVSSVLTTPLHLAIAASAIPAEMPKALEPATLAAIIYSGVFSTGVAYATWHAGVRAVGGSHAAVYQNVVTLVAVVGGWVVLREQPLTAQIVGGLLTILGLYLMRRGRN